MGSNINYQYQYPGLNKSDILSSKITIKISCNNLPKFDKLSKSDPKVFIFIEKKEFNNINVNSIWSLIDSTEIIKNNNNPIFTKTLTIDYYFETIQKLRFMVMDMDGKSEEWKKNDFIGYVDVTLGDLVNSSESNVYTSNLLTSVPPGIEVNNSKAKSFSGTSKIFFRIEENNTDSRYRLKFDISGKNLDKKDILGKSDPFIIISSIEDNGTKRKIFETPVIKNTLNPKWDTFEILEKDFNNGDNDKLILFEVYDWDKDTKNDLIERIRIKPYTFMEYPLGGTEIAVSFAIDFTLSNGYKDDKDSLHYNRPDFDINNFYTLNNPNNPSVYGVNGVINAYHKALQTTDLSGPTNFAPIIRKISDEARKSLLPPYNNKPLSKYYILTIITDGSISDMEKTKEAIIDACDLPLSIIIIGIGSFSQFTKIERT
ncbi:hypothetical protein PIROE2DRAFT_12454 [Piromyces sp. E2]|nr:hypothetical protein PIROE2DRAFT_12454 [Piromyces sp. E2]|eukprot:OUM61541.1 hypothetical protein PIROE2DRAFT_12454 [Piromyces sp. E2]